VAEVLLLPACVWFSFNGTYLSGQLSILGKADIYDMYRVDSSSDQQRVIANAQDSTTNCSDEDYSSWSVCEMKRHDFSSENVRWKWPRKIMTRNQEVCVADKETTMFRLTIESQMIKATYLEGVVWLP